MNENYHQILQGRLSVGDGSIYDGMWRYGKRSGLGTFYFNNGDVFQGSWRDDIMHGKVSAYFLVLKSFLTCHLMSESLPNSPVAHSNVSHLLIFFFSFFEGLIVFSGGKKHIYKFCKLSKSHIVLKKEQCSKGLLLKS